MASSPEEIVKASISRVGEDGSPEEIVKASISRVRKDGGSKLFIAVDFTDESVRAVAIRELLSGAQTAAIMGLVTEVLGEVRICNIQEHANGPTG